MPTCSRNFITDKIEKKIYMRTGGPEHHLKVLPILSMIHLPVFILIIAKTILIVPDHKKCQRCATCPTGQVA